MEKDVVINGVGFYKRTRKGKVVKLTKEKYLRPDVHCGFHLNAFVSISQFLEYINNSAIDHVLVVDTNEFIREMDIFEYKFTKPFVVIVLQTVLQELRNVNISSYRRLLTLIKDPHRHFIFYPNEFSTVTSILRFEGEIINDFNDRQIRNVCKQYQAILTTQNIGKVILISEDVENKNKAKYENIPSYSIQEYVKIYMRQYPILLDLLSSTPDVLEILDFVENFRTDKLSDSTILFPTHLSMTDITNQLNKRISFKGIIRCEKGDISQCYVIINIGTGDEEIRKSVRIFG
jgi:exosome complex exonuclease DIS3/RRP44